MASLDYVIAMNRLRAAVKLAKSEVSLPTDWTARAAALSDSSMPSTYTPFVMTALLAKATDETIDAYAIKADAGPRAYSARGLAHKILVPVAQESGIELRTKGREPLNNQPFFRYDRVDEIERVHDNAALEYLLSVVDRVERLDSHDALLALAAVLRLGLKSHDGEVAPDVLAAPTLGVLVTAVEEFLRENPEGGLRAQAVVAAALSCVFSDVRTGHINDPSRRLPGDIHVVGRGAEVVLAVEVKAKAVELADAEIFRARARHSGVEKVLLVALAIEQSPLAYDALVDLSSGQEATALQIIVGPVDLIASAATWSGLSASGFAAAFPRHLAERLLEVGAPRRSVSRWARITCDFATDE